MPLPVALYDYRAMHRDVLALSDDVISDLQSRIETEVASYLGPIPGIVQFTREMLADQALLSFAGSSPKRSPSESSGTRRS